MKGEEEAIKARRKRRDGMGKGMERSAQNESLAGKERGKEWGGEVEGGGGGEGGGEEGGRGRSCVGSSVCDANQHAQRGAFQ